VVLAVQGHDLAVLNLEEAVQGQAVDSLGLGLDLAALDQGLVATNLQVQDLDQEVQDQCLKALGQSQDQEVLGQSQDQEVLGQSQDQEVLGQSQDQEVLGQSQVVQDQGQEAQFLDQDQGRDLERTVDQVNFKLKD
jgi:hypothetical protein